MSYKALYRKYRPASFNEVLGQDHIVNTLKNIIVNRKISHAYLFSGPRGVGKTSLAKIFAAILNCYHNKDVTQLCAKCNALINQNVDIVEMDAASNNGIDQIRELKEKIVHAPVMGKYKVYIIDEVHMLSKSAFNALLKTLEEPPEHAIFILATTDPQKIPLTILSRVQRFNFRRIPNNILAQQIKDILDKENIKSDDKTISYIARLATGGMRDALSIVDQTSAYGNGIIKIEDVMYAFGLTSNDNLIAILNLLFKKELNKALEKFNFLQNAGIDPIQFIQGLINVLKDYIVFSRTYDSKFLVLITHIELEELEIDIDFAYEVIDILYELDKQLIYSELPFQIIEMSLIKISDISKYVRRNNETKENKEKIMNKKNKTEDILSQTQEILLENIETNADLDDLSMDLIDKESEYNDQIISTGEIDLSDEMLLFENPEANLASGHKNSFKTIYSDKALLNIFLQCEANLLTSYQNKIDFLLQQFSSEHYKNFIDSLRFMTLSGAGKNFIILTSNGYNSIHLNYLQDNGNDSYIQEIIYELFKQHMHLIILDEEKYRSIAKEAMNVINSEKKMKIKELGEVKIRKSKTIKQKILNAVFDSVDSENND